ncbi:MHS family MFS transporter [Paenibacillus frigoriresistens]|uniref:MFS transporter n=1 Tax=Paenibacillus alginolyticus TaxID=59839 RepID=UPI00156645AC|nr:MFS transporter [Paenibacillus frigoriresistens]NRF93212.1 MHS family MFS transporter [Paenibacillus frigoriresistens]
MALSKKEMRQVAMASLIGSAIEWYDWFLYGTAAALVFNSLFFPKFDPLIGTLLAFATFGAGFLARPLGGIIFGYFGDKLGRKKTLIICLALMGIGTFAIGLLPSYNQIGIWAPILLVSLRVIQGIAVGGEWGGAVLLAIEHSPEGKRGFYGSWPQMGVPVGLLLSTLVFSAFSSLPQDQFMSWGWRIPFLLSILLITTGLFIRLKVMETPAFIQAKEAGNHTKNPLKEVLRTSKKDILIALCSRFANDASYYISNVFVLLYATKYLSLDKTMFLTGISVGAVVEIFTIPLFGALSDKIGRRPVFMAGSLFFVLFAFPFFWLVETQNTVLIWLALVLWIAVGHGATFAPMSSFIAERFDTNTRYTGASISYQLSGILIGGPAPFLATALLTWAGHYWPIAVYVVILGIISSVAVYVATETYRKDITKASPSSPAPDSKSFKV